MKVDVCGICGTDIHILEGSSRSRPPVVLGHEYAGTVEDPGTSSAHKTGDTVAIDPNISCGVCYYCRRGMEHLCENLRSLGVDIDGGLAELCIVPEKQLFAIPADLPAAAKAFIEPVSCAVHGIDRAGIRAGDTVAILGCGTVGLLMLQLARNAGAARTIGLEPLARKREIARMLGADFVLDPSAAGAIDSIRDITGVGPDVVIECVGKPGTMEQAVSLVRRGGTVEFFGVCPIGTTIPVEPNMIYFRELTITGSYVNPHTFSRAIAMLQSGRVRIDAFDLHRFPLEGIDEAFRYQREGLTIKSIVEPNK